MSMESQANREPAGTVLLEAFDVSHNTVLKASIPVDEYYGGSHPVIDENDFRREQGIRFVHGRIFDYDGKLDQEFRNEYDTEGVYVRSRIVHADGTIIED